MTCAQVVPRGVCFPKPLNFSIIQFLEVFGMLWAVCGLSEALVLQTVTFFINSVGSYFSIYVRSPSIGSLSMTSLHGFHENDTNSIPLRSLQSEIRCQLNGEFHSIRELSYGPHNNIHFWKWQSPQLKAILTNGYSIGSCIYVLYLHQTYSTSVIQSICCLLTALLWRVRTYLSNIWRCLPGASWTYLVNLGHTVSSGWSLVSVRVFRWGLGR